MEEERQANSGRNGETPFCFSRLVFFPLRLPPSRFPNFAFHFLILVRPVPSVSFRFLIFHASASDLALGSIRHFSASNGPRDNCLASRRPPTLSLHSACFAPLHEKAIPSQSSSPKREQTYYNAPYTSPSAFTIMSSAALHGTNSASGANGEVDIKSRFTWPTRLFSCHPLLTLYADLGHVETPKVQGTWTVEKALEISPGTAGPADAGSPLPYFHLIERLKTTKREGWRRFGIARLVPRVATYRKVYRCQYSLMHGP